MTPADLKAARLQLGLTQAGLAALMGVTKTAVSMWERAERRMPPWMPLVIDGLRYREGANHD